MGEDYVSRAEFNDCIRLLKEMGESHTDGLRNLKDIVVNQQKALTDLQERIRELQSRLEAIAGPRAID